MRYTDRTLVTEAPRRPVHVGADGRAALAFFTFVTSGALLIAAGTAFGSALVPGSHFGPTLKAAALAAMAYHVIATFVLLLFYARHLMDNPAISQAGKVLWAGAFLFLAPLMLPLYWVIFVRRGSLAREGRTGRTRVQIRSFPVEEAGATA